MNNCTPGYGIKYNITIQSHGQFIIIFIQLYGDSLFTLGKRTINH